MNWAIYQSFARIPLGLAVTIEFVGPLTLAVVGSRRPRDLVWVALAALGVGLLGFEHDRARPGRASLFALLAGAAWAAYILLSAQTGRRWPGLDGLAVASVRRDRCCWRRSRSRPAAPTCSTRGSSLLGAAVGLLSSVIPYSCELVGAAHACGPAVFSILMSLEPAAAALVGDAGARGVPEPAAVGGRGGRDRRERRRDPRLATRSASPSRTERPELAAAPCRRVARNRRVRWATMAP